MAILAMMGHGQDARGTSPVGTSGAGPRPNPVRPHIARNILAKRTSIYGIAMQGQSPHHFHHLVKVRGGFSGKRQHHAIARFLPSR